MTPVALGVVPVLRVRPRFKRHTRDCERCPAYALGEAALATLAARVGWKMAAELRAQPRPALCLWGRRLMILRATERPRHCGLRSRRPIT